MRALERDFLKSKNELVQTKKNADAFKKMVHAARERALGYFRSMYKQKNILEQKNQILLTSLKNFNKTCNDQKNTIRIQERGLVRLHKTSEELRILKSGLLSIREVHKRNPHVHRKANI